MDELRIILIIAGLILLAAIYWKGRRDERRALEKQAPSQDPDSSTAVVKQAVQPWDQEILTRNPVVDHADYDSFYLNEDKLSDNNLNEDNLNPDSLNKDRYDSFLATQVMQTRETHSSTQPQSQSIEPAATRTVAASKPQTTLVAPAEPDSETVSLPGGVEPLLVNLTVMAPKDMSFDPYYLRQILDESGLVHGDMNIYHYYRKPKLEFEANRGQRLFSVASIVEPGYFDPEDMNTYRTPGVALFLQLPGPIDGVLAFEKMHHVAVMLSKQLSGILCDEKRNKITLQAVTHIKDQISEYNLKLRTKLKHTVH